MQLTTVASYWVGATLLVAISDVPNTWGPAFYLARALICAVLCFACVAPLSVALTVLIMLGLTGQDNVGEVGDFAAYTTASVWQLPGGSWLFVACILSHLIRMVVVRGGRAYVPTQVKWSIIWFLTVPVAAAFLFDSVSAEYAATELVRDIKFAPALLGALLTYLMAQRSGATSLAVMLSALIGSLLARHGADLLYVLNNIGPAIAVGTSRGSEDSAKGGVVILAFLGFASAFWGRSRLVGLGLGIASTALLISYGTRMLWVTFVAGAVLVAVVRGVRAAVMPMLGVAACVGISAWALCYLNPALADVVLARFLTMTEGRDQARFAIAVPYNAISRIDPIRYAEAVNVWDDALRRGTLLCGSGYGGYYHDVAIQFPADLKDTFPPEALGAGQFHTAHGFFSHIFLKHGAIGLVVVTSVWALPVYRLLKAMRKAAWGAAPIGMLHLTMTAMVATSLTAMLQLYWSTKGLVINGILISTYYAYSEILARSSAISRDVGSRAEH